MEVIRIMGMDKLKINMSLNEFAKHAVKARVIKPGEEAFSLPEKSTTKTQEIIPRRKIDFGYETIDDLLQEISKRYDLENMKPWELSQVLSMLEEGGVITSQEFWLGQSIIPVSGAGNDVVIPEEPENLIRDYYADFENFVNKYSDLYSLNSRQRLHDSLLVHKKFDLIFQEIQSYRYDLKA